MKFLLIPLVCVASHAMACPADSEKNASAASSGKVVAAAKAAPNSAPVAAAPTSGTSAKVAAKSAVEPRKSAPL
jgi:hypothetical protein